MSDTINTTLKLAARLTYGEVGGYDPLQGTWSFTGLGDRELADLLFQFGLWLRGLGVNYQIEVEFFHDDGRAITGDLPANGTFVVTRV